MNHLDSREEWKEVLNDPRRGTLATNQRGDMEPAALPPRVLTADVPTPALPPSSQPLVNDALAANSLRGGPDPKTWDMVALFANLDTDLDNHDKTFNRAMNAAAVGLYKRDSAFSDKAHKERYADAQLHLPEFAPDFEFTRPSRSKRVASPEGVEDVAVPPKCKVVKTEQALSNLIVHGEVIVKQKTTTLKSKVRPLLSNFPDFHFLNFLNRLADRARVLRSFFATSSWLRRSSSRSLVLRTKSESLMLS